MRLLRRTARAALVGISTLAFATACGDATGTSRVEGRYDLVSVNGQALPVTVYQDSDELDEIVGGWVELYDDGRFEDAVVFRSTVAGFPAQQSTDLVTGDYELQGDEVIFFPDDGSEDYSMIRSGSTLRQTIGLGGGQTATLRYSR